MFNASSNDGFHLVTGYFTDSAQVSSTVDMIKAMQRKGADAYVAFDSLDRNVSLTERRAPEALFVAAAALKAPFALDCYSALALISDGR
jgi:hypothetical protein